MPIQSITLNSVTPQPLPEGSSSGTATITYTLTGNYTGTITIYATPVGGGTPVAIGSITVSQANGNHTYTATITLNTSSLDPNPNWDIYAQGSNGTTSNTITNVDVIPCFVAGTRIATARGEVAVEDLRVGDLVVTQGRGAALQPVAWLGHSRVDIARHREPARVAPIRIAAGALAEGVPHRDLCVSPDHGIALDGHLVPAGLLVNGASIVQELWRPEVTYWHVELPAHALLVAEGATTESYLDNGNRAQFDNHAIATLFKDFATERAKDRDAARSCLPLLMDGPLLARIRARLAKRVAALQTATRRSA
jgi:hypothetical protein